SGPLCPSLAALEQYYQREGRDWERYALIKARPVAGDPASGREFMGRLRPFVYRRYIDFTAIEALQEMHASVSEDARRRERLDDIKRGPGGIREIEFLAQCFQLLRGGREPGLQTPSLIQSLAVIEHLALLDAATLRQIRADYVYLRRMENRIQALRDQQTHTLPQGSDLKRLARAMGDDNDVQTQQQLAAVRHNVMQRFQQIFPAQAKLQAEPVWVDAWRHLQTDRQSAGGKSETPDEKPMSVFLRSLARLAPSQRAQRRLDQFMPVLLHRLDRRTLDDRCLHHLFDLVLAISQRSAYLVLLVQNAPALDRLIDLFSRSEWVASCVIRFPALLDELIDPSLGRQIPGPSALVQSVHRLSASSEETEAVLVGLN
ncbi:MAG: bifunctional [glutamate--ammonia ligase]-adenylyl-L-tyrosine phosphorylase/[glutamate--ammonia-ligase] adenylyltransferase, partial [Lysobacterales bacterium]